MLDLECPWTLQREGLVYLATCGFEAVKRAHRKLRRIHMADVPTHVVREFLDEDGAPTAGADYARETTG